ncbi:MAG: hypothetical protein A2836_00195 [Candidatus Taylorbacteria bacterium RIFCSPHIGHO2_01_FULL_45_63]|uniref:Uncharacterized protein n=1 Tax=Candidatus Taylorbacteria bacterium RIFCSPHIGHO2_02_FULL_45_35 TaxID=1802311 RepID=A0A1G2MVG6_9BACT|nr:MAG: hypothetical protein A2836_00195 [Candidatus Taylorbacteria bacterium RIFCSPHIGHO2_01_FULL_45_63]OHA27847.1 MAG: hypothetical protein A3D56_01360 [Candidatus Taylorbacteria bacterium RIFCSPHIGHO2_02_FULL_45_35]OHA32410.1 MAG: hypothetical protein A3A22_00930 [Candidatus Taylorbacteria bacterium RIFCSPLOWO2_01_FULL_45_34b]
MIPKTIIRRIATRVQTTALYEENGYIVTDLFVGCVILALSHYLPADASIESAAEDVKAELARRKCQISHAPGGDPRLNVYQN